LIVTPLGNAIGFFPIRDIEPSAFSPQPSAELRQLFLIADG